MTKWIEFDQRLRRIAALMLMVGSVVLSGCSGDQQPTGWPEQTDASQGTGAAGGSPSLATDAIAGAKPSSSGPSESGSDQAMINQPADRGAVLAAAGEAADLGQHQKAIGLLQPLLLADPEDAEALFRLANAYQATNRLEMAVKFLESISEEDPQAGLPALGQAADWYLQLEQYDKAERNYLKVLQRVPTFVPAIRQLAQLYNRQGRRHEAVAQIQALCRIGDVRQDELHALLMVGSAIYDDASQPGARQRYLPIGPSAKARILYTETKYREAMEVLKEQASQPETPPSIKAFYGLLAIESQNQDEFERWFAKTDETSQQYAEYWAAIGAHLVNQAKFEPAVRVLCEALVRDPTDTGSLRRLNQSLRALGREDDAERCLDQYTAQRDVVLAVNSIGQQANPNASVFTTMADGLEKLGRDLEAVTWRLVQAHYATDGQSAIEQLSQQRSRLAQSADAFGDELTKLCGLKRDEFPMPDLSELVRPPVDDPQADPLNSGRQSMTVDADSLPPVRFRNVASEVGLEHTFWIASQPQVDRFTLYQAIGGGTAVLDYDLDGWPDLYLNQGGSDAPDFVSQRSNLLFRNVEGQFQDHTASSATEQFGYSIGLTSGDWNQDGFDDLVVANLGDIFLMLNNGDGTFRQVRLKAPKADGELISSLAMGDLSGNGLPDLYAAYYVEDPTMVKRPPIDAQGNIEVISPASFTPAIDKLIVNHGDGSFTASEVTDDPAAASTGLGVVIANWDNQDGLDVFVGNDIRPNHLWVRDPESRQWSDIAAVTGCAYGHGGSATASMGIAVADFDSSGTPDIHITNFFEESVSLFLNRQASFVEQSVAFDLYQDSYQVLGFGCQAIDYNNDGFPDLAVTNGSIERTPDAPFHQPPQFFVNLGKRFALTDVEDSSGYWQQKTLGRSMSRLDFNRDGRSDLLISHLDRPTAIILNETDSQNHWLQLELIGTGAERDAIGAKVTVTAGGRTWSQWIFGGDGYLCRNEPVLNFGIGSQAEAAQVEVTWPDGSQQRLGSLPADQRYLIIQGQDAEQMVIGGSSLPAAAFASP